MVSLGNYYLPPDRLHAIAVGEKLPLTVEGTVLFADISGFTPVTERLRTTLGARRGADELASHLNRVYDALIAQVDHYGGSIIGFAGDAITCWFSGEATARATACGFALLEAMRDVEQIMLPDGEKLLLGLKVAITSGITKRFVVGDPAIQLIDALAGAVVARMASGEELAERGELLVDAPTVAQLGEAAKIREWRGSEPEQFAVLESFETSYISHSMNVDTATLPDELLLPWLLPPLAHHFQAGLGEFQIELRPVTALFLQFSGIDYDEDINVENNLDQFVRLVQSIVSVYEGNVLQLTIGDKGSYIYAAFGAPFAHEDDPSRALNAALDIREQAKRLPYLDPVQIGISQGAMRAGAYGGTTRRTYGVLGDEVNLAARLMARAAPSEILVSETLSNTVEAGFVHEALPPIVVKGKANPIGLFRLLERHEHTFAERFYTTPLVGREETLAMLKNTLQPILEGRHAGVITLLGEPGMGKSRLAFEAQQQLQQDGMNASWFTGQAEALNRAPLSTFTYFLRSYFGQQRDQNHAANLAAFDAAFEDLFALADEANQADLTLYRSYLAGILNLVIPDSSYETADEKLQIDNSIIAIKAWVRAEARRQPLILHLEDAQWLDPSSIRAVQQLTYNMEDVPVALLLTSRYNDDGSPYTIANIYSVPVLTIDLNQLNEEGVRAVTEAVLQGDVSEGLARFVQQRAEGNPFFTEQIVLDLKERGALTALDGVWDIRADAAAEVPAGVNAVLIARIDRLTARVKAVVQTAAVLGREFEVEVLSRMLREADTSAVREAEREAIWSSLDEIRYLFRHALLRDAAYEMQAQERLKTLHRLAAETIETLYQDDGTQADILLEHWHAADEFDRELPYLNTVARHLIEITAQYAQARGLLERGLGKLGENDPRRAMLLNWLSAYHLRQGNFAQAVEAAEQAHLLASPEDRTTRATSLYRLGSAAGRRDSYVEAEAYFEQSLALYQALNDKAGIATILNLLGEIKHRQGAYAQARTTLEQSLRLWREMDNPGQIAVSLTTLADIERSQGRLSEARTYAEESLILQREIGAKAGIAGNLNQLGMLARMEGYYQAAHAYHEQALAITVEIGSRLVAANTLISIGNNAFVQGAWSAARDYWERALAVLRDVGEPIGIAGSLNNLGLVATMMEDYEAAEAYYQESLTIRQTIGTNRGIADTLNNLGTLAFRQENYQAAEPYHRESLRLHRELDDGFVNSSRAWLARSLLRMDRLEEAGDLLREGINVYRKDDVLHKLALCLVAAELRWKRNELEAAAELAGLILSNPSVDSESRMDAEKLLDDLRPHLDASTLDTALERGKSLSLDEAVARLLVELG